MEIQICIGSSCCLKGSEELVNKFQDALALHHLEDRVQLSGSFCLGTCNREGVSVRVDDQIHVGITPETFRDFFENHVLKKLSEESE